MNLRFGPSFLSVSILALFLLPHVCWSAPQVAADAAYAKKIEAMLLPKVECILSSPNVVTGQSVTVTAQVQGASAGLVYSFSSDGGKLYPEGPVARLDTTGVPAGRTISTTCQVTNGTGKKGSGTVVVHVVAIQFAHLPHTKTAQTQAAKAGGHAPVAESAEVAAINGLGGNGGSPQGGAGNKALDYHPAPVAQGAAAQAAPAQQPEGGVWGAAQHVPAAAPPPPAAGAVDPYVESEAHAQWIKALKDGKIEYHIPFQMTLHETSVVTVILHGYADTSQNNLAGAEIGVLKVSPYMRMQLTADNPDEFEIDPKVAAVLPVPIESSATWTWNVKPNQPAKNQKLTIEAFTVYTENGDNPQELLPSYIATVSVSVPGFWESLREDFWNDPSAVMKYLLPGGAGFTALAGLVVWWWKRRHPSPARPDTKPDDGA
ncbi:MAG: hypothetical protein ABI380_05165 [Edaphobacter sp.]